MFCVKLKISKPSAIIPAVINNTKMLNFNTSEVAILVKLQDSMDKNNIAEVIEMGTAKGYIIKPKCHLLI